METLRRNIEPGFLNLKFDKNNIPEIELIENALHDTLLDSAGVIRAMCSHVMDAGGKRIRPLLVLYSGLAFSGLNDSLVNASVAAELIHMASIVHDDIIDNSALRRSKPSINSIWGNQFAVLCGDYLFARAFSILSGYRLNRSMEFMVLAIQNMCSGEILQASERFNTGISLDRYYEIIAGKTAVFLECCCKSGAAISGAGREQIQAVGEYGRNLGYAFQIVDDILDFCGDAEKMGKPGNEDLCQGNITMPLIFLLRNDRYGKWAEKIIAGREFTVRNIEDITAALKELGIIENCFDAARSHIETAKFSLSLIPDSYPVRLLSDMADMLQARMN